MKITVAFQRTGDGEGQIRATTHHATRTVLTVGSYAYRNGKCTAVLWSIPGDPESAVSVLTGTTVAATRNKTAERLRIGGRWWK